jgi:carboxypeptidase D
LDRNEQKVHEPWNLKGLLIGNGWISGVDQYPSWLQYAYKYNILTPGSAEATTVEKEQAICDKSLSEGGKDHVDDLACENVLGELLKVTSMKSGDETQCYNMYDVRLRDTFPSCGMNWPPDLTQVTPYLRRQDVKDALHVNPDKNTGWVECNGGVSGAFNAAHSKPSVKLLPDLLAELPIILFSGDQDLICNHIGTEELINNMEWNGGQGFEISDGVWAPRRQWTFDGEPAGIYQEARNLTYILFYNSSHMVPFDYARRTRDMLDRFMGVDITSIGGEPSDSRIDGEKGPVTSAGAPDEESQMDALKEATWRAYQRSGEVALVVVALAAGVWGWFVWRERKKRMGGYKYTGVSGGEEGDGPAGGSRGIVPAWRRNGAAGERDVEAADFDENELENLAGEVRSKGGRNSHDMETERYSLGEDSEDDDMDVKDKTQANGHGR